MLTKVTDSIAATLRYAGANRLKVDIHYRAENGRRGPRRVEPYSLCRTRT
jgi:predicted DNA-binding transcriptional regulator YafY